jgi:hypothetical protein
MATTQTEAKTDKPVQFSKKSGKGVQEGLISELASFWDVKPGHEQELRAATRRFADFLRSAPVEETMKTGLRDTRHVIFDGGKRLLWATTFEQDWDPYIEDALIVVGIDRFLDWMQHTEQAAKVEEWLRDSGGVEKVRAAQGSYKTDPQREKATRAGTSGLKEIIKSVQTQAAAYFNPVSYVSHPQIRKALQVNEAFQQVLDNPDAAEALKNPALKPLLDLASG